MAAIVDLVDPAAAFGARAGKDHPAYEVGSLQGDHLRDAAAQREAEKVDLARVPWPE